MTARDPWFVTSRAVTDRPYSRSVIRNQTSHKNPRLLASVPPRSITEQSSPRTARPLVVSIRLSGRNDPGLSPNNGRSPLEHHWEFSTLQSIDSRGPAWSLRHPDFSAVHRDTTPGYRMSFRRVECARQPETKAPADSSLHQAHTSGTQPVRPS